MPDGDVVVDSFQRLKPWARLSAVIVWSIGGRWLVEKDWRIWRSSGLAMVVRSAVPARIWSQKVDRPSSSNGAVVESAGGVPVA